MRQILSRLVTIVTKLLVLVVVIQVYYWYYYFIRLVDHRDEATFNGDKEVDILICARNEAENIRKNGPSWANQNIEEYRLIVVDDSSTDQTGNAIRELQNAFGHIRYIKNESCKGKKEALSKGLTHAHATWLLLTDADCEVKPGWAKSMMDGIRSDETDLVLGYSPMKMEYSGIGIWAHFECWITAVQYLSFAEAGIPYMGVGRNILYRRRAISRKNIMKYDHLMSGDDDLTVMQIATEKNTSICLTPESFVYTQGPESLSHYIKQKRRHYSTATSYKLIHKILLGLYAISQILNFLLLALLIIEGAFVAAAILYGIRLALIIPVALKLIKKLESGMNTIQFIYLDFLQSLYYAFFSLAFVFPKRASWN